MIPISLSSCEGDINESQQSTKIRAQCFQNTVCDSSYIITCFCNSMIFTSFWSSIPWWQLRRSVSMRRLSDASDKTITQTALNWKKMSENSWNLEVSRFQAWCSHQGMRSSTAHFFLLLQSVILASGSTKGWLIGADGFQWQPGLCASCSDLKREKE